MSDNGPGNDQDAFGTFYRSQKQAEQAQTQLDQPDATDDVTWSPPTSRPAHSESPDDSAEEETIDERIAQEESEQGSAYGAPEAGGVLSGADDPAAEGPNVGGEDADAIPAHKNFLGTTTSDEP